MMWKDVVANCTNVQFTNKETSGIPVTKTKKTTRVKDNKELMFINLKNSV